MTAPRQILPGTTYLVTRRCSERRFFLRPSETTNAIFGYLLAVAANRYEIRVHAYCVLSNHFHLVVSDPSARLPEFHRYLDGLVARAVNSSLGRWETFWDPDSYSAVRLEGDAAVIEKIVYVLANPIEAGLVRRGCEWPGLWSDPAPGEPRRDLSPRLACSSKWKRIEALLRLDDFGRAYREALRAWRAGVRDAVFPRGTWLMRVQHGVCCAAPG